MSLPAANFVKNDVFDISKDLARVTNDLICLVVSLMSMLELLVLTNLTKCTSQHLKRSSGAQVMTCSRSLCRSVIARSFDRLIARSIDRSLARSFARSFELFHGFKFRIMDILGNYLGVRISNCWRASYLFRPSPNFGLLFKRITIEHVHCFKGKIRQSYIK